MFITLRCDRCDNVDCTIGRAYIPCDSKEGCTRQVPDETADQFYHYIEEVMPFVHLYKNRKQSFQKLSEIEGFLEQNIYSAPLGKRLDAKGKAIS